MTSAPPPVRRSGAGAPATASAGGAAWNHVPERSNLVALRLMAWVATRLGRPAARLLLHPATAYFLLFAPGPRRHARRYLARVLGRPPRWRELYRLFHTFAATVLDRVYFLRGAGALPPPQVRGAAALDTALQRGQGAFLLGAHLGSFEAIGAAGRDVGGQRIAMLMYPDNAQRLNQVLEALAPVERRPRLIALGRPGAMLELRDWLDTGGLAGLLGDRTLPGASQRGQQVEVDFLGQRLRLSDGPFRLAAMLRRPVFFMAGLYCGGARYRVLFEPLADFSVPAANAAGRDAQLAAAVRAYAARLEVLCRAYPYNWFNFHDFWSEDAAP